MKVDDTWAAGAMAPKDPAKAHIAAVCKALARIEGGRLITPVAEPDARLLLLEQ